MVGSFFAPSFGMARRSIRPGSRGETEKARSASALRRAGTDGSASAPTGGVRLAGALREPAPDPGRAGLMRYPKPHQPLFELIVANSPSRMIGERPIVVAAHGSGLDPVPQRPRGIKHPAVLLGVVHDGVSFHFPVLQGPTMAVATVTGPRRTTAPALSQKQLFPRRLIARSARTHPIVSKSCIIGQQ